MTTRRFGETVVDVHADRVETTLPGGAIVYAMPNGREEDRARADALGYADELAMTLEHDPLHVALTHALGLPESPTLRGAIAGELPDSELFDAEEAMVLAAQRFLNLCRHRGAFQ